MYYRGYEHLTRCIKICSGDSGVRDYPEARKVAYTSIAHVLLPTTFAAMEGIIPAKRPRTDESCSTDKPVVRRSNFWLNDANIVLQADSVQFAVHRSVLAMHSQVFKDMCHVGSPVLDGSTVDGCPVVHLSDQADDLEMFLMTLYGDPYVHVSQDFDPTSTEMFTLEKSSSASPRSHL